VKVIIIVLLVDTPGYQSDQNGRLLRNHTRLAGAMDHGTANALGVSSPSFLSLTVPTFFNEIQIVHHVHPAPYV
jgi:hypothetical protein